MAKIKILNMEELLISEQPLKTMAKTIDSNLQIFHPHIIFISFSKSVNFSSSFGFSWENHFTPTAAIRSSYSGSFSCFLAFDRLPPCCWIGTTGVEVGENGS